MAYSGSGLVKMPLAKIGDGALIMWTFKQEAVAKGWTVERSGDGLLAFNDSGDVLTSSGTGANGMDNTNSWFVLRQPSTGSAPYAGTREFLFQSDAGSNGNRYQWTVAYSFSDGYASGSGTATQVPALPTDNQFLVGSGTPGSLVSATLFGDSGQIGEADIQVGDVDENFSFFVLSRVVGVGAYTSSIFFDSMESGSFDVADVDPYVMRFAKNSLSTLQLKVESLATMGYILKGLGGEGFVGIAMDTTNNLPGNIPISPYTSKDPLFRIAYLRGANESAPRGAKGVSHLWRWNGIARTLGSTISVGGPGTHDHIQADDVVGPWPGVVGF